MIAPDLKVLVVDPMATATRAVSDQLREAGFVDIDQAHDGQSALQMLGQGPYGLVLSEWELGGGSGLDFLKAVRSDPARRNLPFLLMTHHVEVERVIAARQAGVSGYLVKPFSNHLLKQKLAAIFATGGARLA